MIKELTEKEITWCNGGIMEEHVGGVCISLFWGVCAAGATKFALGYITRNIDLSFLASVLTLLVTPTAALVFTYRYLHGRKYTYDPDTCSSSDACID